jgi:hypothetical protein
MPTLQQLEPYISAAAARFKAKGNAANGPARKLRDGMR